MSKLIRCIKWIVGALVVIALASTLRACYYAGRVKEVLDTTRPLPQRAIKAIVAKGRADSVKAKRYEHLATRAWAHADSLGRVAAEHTSKADSLHEELSRLPAATGGPLSAVQRHLATYPGFDSTQVR